MFMFMFREGFILNTKVQALSEIWLPVVVDDFSSIELKQKKKVFHAMAKQMFDYLQKETKSFVMCSWSSYTPSVFVYSAY